MRVLENAPFKGIEPFILGDSSVPGSDHPACISEVILRTLQLYRPFPSRTLGINELRAFNRLCKYFSEDIEAYGISEEDWTTLLTVCVWTLPRCPWFRQGPAVMDCLEAVKEQR